MPTYTVKAPDGKTFKLTGDSAPTEQELEEIFSTASSQKTSEEQSLAQEQFGNESPSYNPLNVGGMMAGSVGASGTQPGAAMPAAGQMIGNMIPNPALSAVGGVAGAMAGEGLRNLVGKVIGVNDSKSVLDQMIAKGKSAAVSEATGLALNGILGQVLNSAKPAANKMMNSIMNPSRDVLKKNPKLGTEVLNRGVWGNPQKIKEQASSFVENSEGQLQAILSGRKETVSMNPFRLNLQGKMSSLHDSTDKSALQGVLDDWIEPYSQNGYSINVSRANEIKRELYSKLGDRAYLSTITNEKKEALKGLAEHLKTSIENAVKDEPIKELNRGMSVMINAKKAVDNVIAIDSKKSGFGISDLAYGTLGAILGKGGGLLENLGEAVATASLGRLLGSKTIRGGVAAGLNALPTDAIKETGKTTIAAGKPIFTSLLSRA